MRSENGDKNARFNDQWTVDNIVKLRVQVLQVAHALLDWYNVMNTSQQVRVNEMERVRAWAQLGRDV